VEWGKHVWLDVEPDEKWKDIVLINTVHYRWPINIDFNLLYQLYSDSILFIGSDLNEYYYFLNDTKLNIKMYQCTSFTELCVAIKSCKLYSGSLSMPLTIAHSVHKERVCGICNLMGDSIHNIGLDGIWTNIRYAL